MNIIIIGGGKVGRRLVELLQRENHNVVLVDIKSDIVDRVVEEYDVMGVAGSAISCETLSEAGVEKTDLTIAVTTQDELNVLCCIMASKMGSGHCVARVRNPEYFAQSEFMRTELNISMIVNPEFLAANEISRMIRFPAAIKTETFCRGRVELVQIKVYDSSPLVGMELSELYSKHGVKVLICAVERGNEIIIPKGDFVLCEGDKINITAGHADIMSFMRKFRIVNQKLRSVIIIGGGKIALYLARALIESGVRVKIIEQKEQRCRELAATLPKADIIHGDGTSKEVLDEEGIENTDALVMLTGIDEENIIMSMYGRMRGVNKVITKVDRLEFADLVETIGIDSIITPKDITANIILGYARAMEASEGTDILAVYQIVDNKVEAVEFRVAKESALTSRPLKDVNLKKGVLIVAVLRKNRLIIPDGSVTIEVGDRLVVLSTYAVRKMEDLLR